MIYVEDNNVEFIRISKLMEQAGYKVIRAVNHKALPQILRQHPHAAAVVSDVDTGRPERPRDGQGLEWAQTYIAGPHKPALLISRIGTYAAEARDIGIDFIPKPMFDDNGPLAEDPSLPEEVRKDQAARLNAFEKRLTGWLKRNAPIQGGVSPQPAVILPHGRFTPSSPPGGMFR